MRVEIGRKDLARSLQKIATHADKILDEEGYGEDFEEIQPLIKALRNTKIDDVKKARYIFQSKSGLDDKNIAIVKAIGTKKGFSELAKFPKIKRVLDFVAEYAYDVLNHNQAIGPEIAKKLLHSKEVKKSYQEDQKPFPFIGFRDFIKS